mmetsp:Transcript_30493/g.56799  ORF Transcript_30493/g.56799 Transcript_30493/m.56799 type:complete len:212 (+) Transcript_30493:32-667(+)
MLSSVEELADITQQNPNLRILTPVTMHPNYEAKELTIKNYLFWVYTTETAESSAGDKPETASNGFSKKTCKFFNYTRESQQLNWTHSHLYNLFQLRKIEARRFHQENTLASNISSTSFFFTAESLPSPSVVFRLHVDNMVFEAFDVVPGSLRHTKQGRTVDINYHDNDGEPSSATDPKTVRVSSFAIHGEMRTALMATLPVLHHKSYLGKG